MLAAIWAGCGSDSETTSSPLTKDQIVKRAEVICHTFESEREEVLSEAFARLGGNSPSSAQKEELLLAVLGPYERMTERLEELGPPQGDKQRYEAMIEALESAVEKAKANPERAFTTNLPFREPNKRVKAYGLENCIA